MFPIKQPIIKNKTKPLGTPADVKSIRADEKTIKYTHSAPKVSGAKKLNTDLSREYHKESVKRASLNIPQPKDTL